MPRPDRAPLPDDAVHVHWIRAAALPPPGRLLTAGEVDAIARLANPELRDARARVRAWMRRELGAYAGVAPERLAFDHDLHGKPLLRRDAAAPPLEFNLSRADAAAVLAVARRPLGVDVETVGPRRNLDLLVEDCCAPGERARLASLHGEDRLRAFLKAWTAKEAYLKAVGRGLSVAPAGVATRIGADGPILSAVPRGLPGPEGWWLTALALGHDHVATLATGWRPRAVRVDG